MLQQTPVARVIPAWEAWMARWPTPKALSQAPLGEVLSQWGRLGYPRRARNLHTTAQVITSSYGGEVPESVEALLALPGIGDYTARAIACFAFGQPHPVVDTNVKRVIARAVNGEAAAGHWSTASGLDRVDRAMDRPLSDSEYCLNQRALMELGALVCTARSPQCEQCPLAIQCQWRALGYPVDQATLPRRQARYEGSDRQVRGVVLRLLREQPGWHDLAELERLWPQRTQLARAVESLVTDGLVEQDLSVDPPRIGLSWSVSLDPGE